MAETLIPAVSRRAMSDGKIMFMGHVPDWHNESNDDGETDIGDGHDWHAKDSRPTYLPDVRRGYVYNSPFAANYAMPSAA